RHSFRSRFKNVMASLETRKRAPPFGGARAPCGFECCDRRVAARVGGLHPAFGREPVEKMPRRIYARDIPVIEFRADHWVALVVNFIAGKKLNVWKKLASVDPILSILNRDVDLARFDFGPVHIGATKTFVQVGMEGCVLQLSGHFETWLVWIRAEIDSEKFAQPKIRIGKLRFGVGQLRLLVVQRPLGAADV